MVAKRTFNAIKASLADGKCFGKTDMTGPRDRIVPSEMAVKGNPAAPQFREDQPAPGSSGDASGWVRGKGRDATKGRPGGFDHSKRKGR